MNGKLQFAGTMEEIRLLFQDMLKLSDLQLKLAEKEDFDQETRERFNTVLLERQSLMSKIDCAQVSAKQFEKELQSSRGENSFTKPSGIYAGYVEQETEIRDIISIIQANDRKSQALLKDKLSTVGQRLGRVRENKKALRYYNPVMPADHAWFIDRKK